jgi:hypothetical protein
MRHCFHSGCDTLESAIGDGDKGFKNFAFLKLTTQALVLTCLDLTTERENDKSSLALYLVPISNPTFKIQDKSRPFIKQKIVFFYN